MCSSIPLESSEDAEWSLFGMSLSIPAQLAAGVCQGVSVETLEICVAVSMCGNYPSIAFGFSSDILSVSII